MRRGVRAIFLLLLALASAGTPMARGADGDAAKLDAGITADAEIATEPVVIDGRALFRVRGITSFPAEERARAIEKRIKQISADPALKPQVVSIVDTGDLSSLMAGRHKVMNITDADARLEQENRADLALSLQERIEKAIATYRIERTRAYLTEAGTYAAVATLLLAAALLALIWLSQRMEALTMRQLHGRIRSLGFQSFEIVREQHLRLALAGLLRGLRLIVGLALIFAYLSWVLPLFPWTRGAGDHLCDAVTQPLLDMGLGFVGIIPNLFFLVMLVLLARFALRLLRLFFGAVEHGNVTLHAFEPEWALPTYKLLRLAVVVFALVVAYPYIPGSDSAAFKGISLFAGVLLSLGSSSVIANIVAGYMITYRRAFRVGDRVQIGEVDGDVIEMRLQVTHLRTLKNEEVVIPNSMILNTHVTNFSSFAGTTGLILHTTVGIGYETPWRQVEAMLLAAAARTQSVLADPAPFVLRTKLGEFAIDYELNAYTNDAQRTLQAYDELHINILDLFNEYAVAIMTPAYRADPAEAKVVPKAKWYEAPARPPEGGPT